MLNKKDICKLTRPINMITVLFCFVIKISIYFTSIFLHRYDHFEDLLTPEEEEEVMREKRIKEAAFAVLAKRNHELQLIKDGELMPKKPRVMTQEEQDKAFNSYLKFFYNKPRLTVSHLSNVKYVEVKC
jgi:hypothetical protein